MNPITPDIRDKAKRCLNELRQTWGNDPYTVLVRDLFAVLEEVVSEE